MATCKQCREFEKCKDDAFINGAKFDPNESVKYCTGFDPITNSDRIRAMSDEELANIMAGTPICKERYMDCIKDGLDCEACLLEWLKQPTKGE